MMLKMQMDTAAGSEAIADGSLPELMGETMASLRPEAAYFGTEDGVRTSYIVFDMADSSKIPSIAEPMFSRVKAKVQMFPVMNQEDLQKGLGEITGSG